MITGSTYKISRSRGLTLIELLIVVAIIAIISGPIFLTLVIYSRNSQTLSVDLGLQDNARLACGVLIRDIASTSGILDEYGSWKRNESVLILRKNGRDKDHIVIYMKKDGAFERHLLQPSQQTGGHTIRIIPEHVKSFEYNTEGGVVRFSFQLGYTFQGKEKVYDYSSAAVIQAL